MKLDNTEISDLSSAQIDQIAAKTAEVCRRIRAARSELRQLAASCPDIVTLRMTAHDKRQSLADLEGKRDELLRVLLPVVADIARGISRRNGDDAQRTDDLALEAQAKIANKIHTFNLPANVSADHSCIGSNEQQVDMPKDTHPRSRFKGWAHAVLRRARVDYGRAHVSVVEELAIKTKQAESRRSNQNRTERARNDTRTYSLPRGLLQAGDDLAAELVFDAQDYRAGQYEPQRPMPLAFDCEEETKLAQLSDRCRCLFLYATDTYRLLSATRREHWAEASVSDFESNELNAVSRAGRFVLRLAEREFLERELDGDTEVEVAFHELHQRIAQSAAQDLNRHFWRFMAMNTAWQRIFLYVEPWDSKMLAEMEREIDPDLLIAYLLCDVLFGCDSADRCFHWFDEFGMENKLSANFARVAGQRTYTVESTKERLPGDSSASVDDDQLVVNPEKWKRACQLAGGYLLGISPREFLVTTLDQVNGPRSAQLVLDAARSRNSVDLPLPFEKAKAGKDAI